jgi:hypothetical protein
MLTIFRFIVLELGRFAEHLEEDFRNHGPNCKH